jgi:hypothetical protein
LHFESLQFILYHHNLFYDHMKDATTVVCPN